MPSGSMLALDMHGEQATWGTTDYLLATIADLLNGANWQRSGGKGRAPSPITRPGAKSDPARIAPNVLAEKMQKLKARRDAKRKGGET